MYYDLFKLKTAVDMTKYTLKDIALYYEKFDGYVCEILTNYGRIRFKFSVQSFPHLIGMQHAYKDRRNSREYKGYKGFDKVKNGEVTYEEMKKMITKDPKSNVAWKNIDLRIKFLPMFLNSITKKTLLKTSIGVRDPERATYMKGSYFLYRELRDGKTPMFSIKKINKVGAVIETFVVDDDKSIIRNLYPVKIKSIKLTTPLESTKPIFEKEEQPVG